MTFEDRVARQAELYFEEILPRAIDAYFGGRGYRLIAELMLAHDRNAIREIRALPSPSRRARKRARGARRQCPIIAVGIGAGTFQHGGTLLGMFTKRVAYISGEVLGSVRETGSEWWVEIFEAGLIVGQIPEERWDDEILITIFHEYLHYFESFLPARHQPLRGREHGEASATTWTPEEGRRRDRRYRAFQIVGGTLAVLFATVLGLTQSGSMPTFDDEGRIIELEERIARLDEAHAKLSSLDARRPELSRAAETLKKRVTALRETDPSYDARTAREVVAEAMGEGHVLEVGNTLVAHASNQTSIAEALDRMAKRAPGLRVTSVHLGRSWGVIVALPTAIGRAEVPTVPRTRAPPTIQSERGSALRERARALEDDIARLQKSVGDLDGVEERLASLEMPARSASASALVAALERVEAPNLELVSIQIDVETATAAWKVLRATHAPLSEGEVIDGRWRVVRAAQDGISGQFRANFTEIR